MSDKNAQALYLLMERPTESLVLPKGEENVLFDLPKNYYKKKYRNNLRKVRQKYVNNKRLVLKNIAVPAPALSDPRDIDEEFSVFIPKHADSAENLIDIFLDAKNTEDLLSIAAYYRERTNSLLFNYALSVAVLHREDTRDITLPNFLLMFPSKFVEASVFAEIRMEANMIPEEDREPIIIARNFTASNNEPEQAVAYFREDLGINLHHWHWHLVYPIQGRTEIVNKDRRGELFYYMHEQVLARYNTERLCNDLDMVKSLEDFRENITEGYFPKLNSLNSNRSWPPRFQNTNLSDVDRPTNRIYLTIDQLEEWRETLKQAIENGKVLDKNRKTIPLDPVKGIDILGNIIEASSLSINRTLYGNLHNMMHVMISYCHDPEERFLEGFGIMGDVATAMRDPIFYRWHSAINDLFVAHKNTLSPYSEEELNNNNITVTELQVHTNLQEGLLENEIYTFWEQSDIDLSRGLDFVSKGSLPIRITYLQHEQFTYHIVVNNDSEVEVMGTVRIFIAPKHDRDQNLLHFDIQRKLMIELDKFSVTILPGSNLIERFASESSVTVPYDVTFRSVGMPGSSNVEMKNIFCGCGWPDHMLIPKGTVDGYKMDLFVMISDYNLDKVEQTSSDVCVGAESYCGLFNKKYPDKRSMGYPFDRPAFEEISQLSQFILPNMKTIEVTIKHEDRTAERAILDDSTPVVIGP